MFITIILIITIFVVLLFFINYLLKRFNCLLFVYIFINLMIFSIFLMIFGFFNNNYYRNNVYCGITNDFSFSIDVFYDILFIILGGVFFIIFSKRIRNNYSTISCAMNFIKREENQSLINGASFKEMKNKFVYKILIICLFLKMIDLYVEETNSILNNTTEINYGNFTIYCKDNDSLFQIFLLIMNSLWCFNGCFVVYYDGGESHKVEIERFSEDFKEEEKKGNLKHILTIQCFIIVTLTKITFYIISLWINLKNDLFDYSFLLKYSPNSEPQYLQEFV